MSAAGVVVFTINAPSSIVAMMVTAYVSKRSAAMPAQSPTLSPTLSAIVAGLRGSSSGMPASTLPTRSAPTSAALVKMPPPTRRKRARSEPPKPNPTRIAADDERQRAGEARPDAAEAAAAEVDAGRLDHLGRGEEHDDGDGYQDQTDG